MSTDHASSDVQDVGSLFIERSAEKFKIMSGHIHTCFAKLSEEQVWHRHSDAENALGNIVLHLCGNVRQWIGSFVGGLADVRLRSEEFSARGSRSKADLLALLDETVGIALDVLKQLPKDRLAQAIRVQDGKTDCVLGAIYHCVGHFQQHTGQIIFATKLFTSEDLGIYRPANYAVKNV